MNHMHLGSEWLIIMKILTPKSFLPINNMIYGYMNKKTSTHDWLSPNFFQLVTGIV